MKKSAIIGFVSIFLPLYIFGQTIDERLAEVQKAVNEENLDRAVKLFDTHTNHYINNSDYLNLSYFVPFAGFIGNKQKDMQYGMEKMTYWLDFVSEKSQDPRVLS